MALTASLFAVWWRAGLFVCLCVCAHAQTEVYTEADLDAGARCLPKLGTVCNGIGGITEGMSVYVNSTATAEGLTSDATSYAAQLLAVQALSLPCYNAAYLFMCLLQFQPCKVLAVNATYSVAIPDLPCRNACDAAKSACDAILKSLNREFPFPCPPNELVYDFSISGYPGNITANCSSGDDRPVDICVPLHESFWPPAKADRWVLASAVFGWVGMVANALVCALYIFNPKLHAWPCPLVIAMSASQVIMSFGLAMSSFAPRRDMLCSAAKKHLCAAQGFFLAAGIHFTIFTWLALTAVTCVLVVHANPGKAQRFLKHKWGFVLLYLVCPAGFTITLATVVGTGRVGSILLYCSTTSYDFFDKAGMFPVIAVIGVGTILWLVTVVTVAMSMGRLHSFKRSIRLYGRMMLYEFLALFPACFVAIPYQLIRKRLRSGDASLLYDGSAERVLILLTLGMELTPLLFAGVFLFQEAHVEFLSARLGLTVSKPPSSERRPETSDDDDDNTRF